MNHLTQRVPQDELTQRLPDDPAAGRKGFRGEPWSLRGRDICDRDGCAFAEVFPGCEEFGRTIVLAVNLLSKLPLRPSDWDLTDIQRVAVELLERERERLPDDER